MKPLWVTLVQRRVDVANIFSEATREFHDWFGVR